MCQALFPSPRRLLAGGLCLILLVSGCQHSTVVAQPEALIHDVAATEPSRSVGATASHRAQSDLLCQALLVGCTNYPSLNQLRQLQGPANDVHQVAGTLTDRFGLAPDRIRILAEVLGTDRRPARPEELPTRANIVREFQRLIREAQAGEHIFILLAGHGSQQPDRDRNPAVDPEPDGLDEVFLPRDIGPWNTIGIQNAIVDDELRQWLSAIVAKGAFVFLVMDSCHSGTATRGVEGTPRQIPSEALGVPAAEQVAADEAVAATASPPSAADWFDAAEAAGPQAGLVALYAAQSHEEALEDRFPDGRTYGRLSHTFCQVLQTSPQLLTYQELAQRIHWTYTQNAWVTRSTPWVEGTNLSREVLGARLWPGRSQLTLTRSRDGYTVSGGLLHRITRGSVLSVHPPAGEPEQENVLGYVIVDNAAALASQVKPIAFSDVAARDEFPDLACCRVVYRELGEMMLSVAAVAEGFDDPSEAEAQRQLVEHHLQRLARGDDALIRMADASHQPEWFAVVRPAGVYLQRASSARSMLDDDRSLSLARKTGAAYGPEPSAAASQWWLQDTLHRLTRAANLRRIADRDDGAWDPSVDVQLSVTRGEQEFQPDTPSSAVRAGDKLRLKIKNTGRKAISVAVFYIQNDCQIKTFFPRTRRDYQANVIDAGAELFAEIGFDINDDTLGWEDVIVIAVDVADKKTLDEIHVLAREGAEARTRGGPVQPAPFRTPLGRFIDAAMNGRTRGADPADAPDFGSYAVRRLTWNVLATDAAP